jgi:hypothetical protein
MNGPAAGWPAWTGFASAFVVEAAWLAALAWMAWSH